MPRPGTTDYLSSNGEQNLIDYNTSQYSQDQVSQGCNLHANDGFIQLLKCPPTWLNKLLPWSDGPSSLVRAVCHNASSSLLVDSP